MAARRAWFGCGCTDAGAAAFCVALVAQLFTTFLFFRRLPRRVLLSSLTAGSWCHY